jgi:hypothetical protein
MPPLQRSDTVRNHLPNTFGILKYFVIPKAQDRNASFFQPKCTALIARRAARGTMLAAINFNREPKRRAVEIDKITPDRMLPTKADFVHLFTLQKIPKLSFRYRRVAAQAARGGGLHPRP